MRLFNERPAEDRDPIALRDLSGGAVRTVVGARRAEDPTIVVMTIAGHMGGVIVGGKPEQKSERPPQMAASLILECAVNVSAHRRSDGASGA